MANEVDGNCASDANSAPADVNRLEEDITVKADKPAALADGSAEMPIEQVAAAVDTAGKTSEQLVATSSAVTKPVADISDLDATRKCVEDAAAVSGGLWLSYLFALFYIGVAAGGVAHRDLLLENSVKLPFINVELPLVAFFFLSPILFLIVHAYTLVHFVMLAAKVDAFDKALRARSELPDADEKSDSEQRRRLPSNVFVQFLAGPEDIREGGLGWLLQAIAWISLVIGPQLLLLLLQAQFLPYHLEWVTWVQRLTVLADIVLLWALWPAVLAGRSSIEWPRLWHQPVLALASLVPIGLAFTVATFPGEWLDQRIGKQQWIPPNRMTAWLGLKQADPKGLPILTSFHDIFFNGEVDNVTRRRKSLFSNTLVLPGFDLLEAVKIDNEKRLDWAKHTFAFRGRHLEGAVFDDSDLRKADLEGAYLEDASLDGTRLEQVTLARARLQSAALNGANLEDAHLEDANLSSASLNKANLHGAHLDKAQLNDASLKLAQLGRASLDGASLQNASLLGAKLQGGSLDGAHLQGACLDHAQLQGASLRAAQLQGAWLNYAQMQGALLNFAGLQTAHLNHASLQGALLDGANLQFTWLYEALLDGASLTNAELQGAWLDRATLLGASLDRAQLQGAQFGAARIQGASFKGAFLMGSNLQNTKLWRTSFEDAHLADVDVETLTLQQISKQEFAALQESVRKEVPESKRFAEGDPRERALRQIAILNPDTKQPQYVIPANLLGAGVNRPAYQKAKINQLKIVACSWDDSASYLVRRIIERRDEDAFSQDLGEVFLAPNCLVSSANAVNARMKKDINGPTVSEPTPLRASPCPFSGPLGPT